MKKVSTRVVGWRYVGKASKCTDTGLVSGTEYWYRVKALGVPAPTQL